MQVSIIIVNYNTKDLIEQCIKSIYNHVRTELFEIIVVDNCSVDGSQDLIKLKFPNVILIQSELNLGFGRANNLGINIAKGRYVFLLNSDTYLIDDAISSFMTYMDKHNDIACCGAELIDATAKSQISFGNFPSVFEAFSELGFFLLYKKYFKRHLASAVINYDIKEKDVDYICGADMFIRKSVLDKIGAFDPDFFLYFEETELCFRFHKMGYISRLLPFIRIVHLEGGSQKTNESFNYNKIRIFTRSRAIFFRKCYGDFRAMTVKILYVLQNLILFLAKGKVDYLRIVKIIINS
ncbi:glycosyltransferase family 2 protein [Pedobacter nutrimenti]|uniref:glycosyltransferase family 2 protein n=1 Tax=Pedobacter nutrimenti TaxID=1241337 RepID=UPI00292FD332|nr:glycosyltransferase family 2 protein [Pedobacter nutrimenti]